MASSETNRETLIQAGKEKAERLSIDRGIREAQLQKDYQDRRKLDTNLTGWTSWWGRMEQEANASIKMERLGKQRRKKEFFTDRVEPNILLTGWRTWWTRMVAESRLEI